jgi:hypothetical protein
MKMNVALLLKWVWRLDQEEDTIWAKIVKAKYADVEDLFSGNGGGGSQFWKSLHKVKHLFKVGAKHEVRDGTHTSFWLDWWLGNAPLKDAFPDLFAICESRDISVACACRDFDLAIRFRRSLDQEGLRQWRGLLDLVDHVELCPRHDKVSWHLEPSGRFSVKSMYVKLS